MAFKLSMAERERLVAAIPEREDLTEWTNVPGDADWMRVEQAIAEILQARGAAALDTGHWVTDGNKDYLLAQGRAHTDTQANERHGLTPKPLHEQRPGAWNFVEPQPIDPAQARLLEALGLNKARDER